VTKTETPTRTETPTFTEVATHLAQSTHRRVAQGHEDLVRRTAADAAKWVMRELVMAETERELYALAANTDHGEEQFVQSAVRYLAAGARSTDVFDRAASEVQAEAALRALRNLRPQMSTESKLAFVEAL
jgi:hypothetical protein